jgi:3-oxoacyl-[acyl-carrier-protein] synthase-1
MSRPPCRLQALGLVTSLGASHDEVWRRLLAGDRSSVCARDDLIPGQSRLFASVTAPLASIPDALAEFRCRNNALALTALEAIAPEVHAALERHGAERVAIVVGTSTSGMGDSETAFRVRARTGSLPDAFALAQLEFGGLSEFLQRATGACGPSYTLSTACSAGGKALIAARTLLELEICDAVIAGAADSLCRLTANGFNELHALSAGHTQPMGHKRDGINIGEGAALFLVTREPGGVQLAGAGESSDAHHISAPDPSGLGAESCMRSALEDAGLAPEAIAYLNLHGTGTPLNDAMESAAVARVLGSATPCSSTKPLVGHTLGASAAIEAAFCWLMLANRSGDEILAPPHCYDGELDPALPPLALVKPGTRLRAGQSAALMSNSFAFGGSNCALLLAAERA